jgi:hypothetical protein
VIFDNYGQVLNHAIVIEIECSIETILISKLDESYVIYLSLDDEDRGAEFSVGDEHIHISDYEEGMPCHTLLLTVDEDFNHITHEPLRYEFEYMAANNSTVLYINSRRIYWYNSKLSPIKGKELDVFSDNLGDQKDFEMSDKYLFVLTKHQKFMIIDLKSSEVLEEIAVNADQLKLVSTDYLALFDSTSRMIYLYDQNEPFDFYEEVNLGEAIEDDMELLKDKSKYFTFYNETQMEYFMLN